MLKLLLATNNRGKVHEYRSLLEGIPYELVTPAGLGIDSEVQESGNTFEENARIKAVTFAARSGLLTLADDSGLEVDALGGEPGILSARYAGEGATDRQRIDFLLAKLKDVPQEKRTARFRCVIAIAVTPEEVKYCSGECEGYINFSPVGEHGFGYDPIFCFPEYNKTMAELPLEVKNRISHRARAAAKAREILVRMGEEISRV